MGFDRREAFEARVAERTGLEMDAQGKIRWGCFTFVYKAVGHWQVTCPWHRRTAVQGCRKTRKAGDAVQDHYDAVAYLKTWCLACTQYNRQRLHLHHPMDSAAIPPHEVLDSHKMMDGPSEAPKHDLQLDEEERRAGRKRRAPPTDGAGEEGASKQPRSGAPASGSGAVEAAGPAASGADDARAAGALPARGGRARGLGQGGRGGGGGGRGHRGRGGRGAAAAASDSTGSSSSSSSSPGRGSTSGAGSSSSHSGHGSSSSSSSSSAPGGS